MSYIYILDKLTNYCCNTTIYVHCIYSWDVQVTVHAYAYIYRSTFCVMYVHNRTYMQMHNTLHTHKIYMRAQGCYMVIFEGIKPSSHTLWGTVLYICVCLCILYKPHTITQKTGMTALDIHTVPIYIR